MKHSQETHELKIKTYGKSKKYVFLTGWKLYPNLGISQRNILTETYCNKWHIEKQIIN